MAEPKLNRFTAHRPTWRAVALGTGLGLALGLLTTLLGALLHHSPPIIPTAGVPAAVGALLMLVRATQHEMHPLEPIELGIATRTASYAVRLRQLERRLQAASVDGAKFDWGLRPLLAQLVAERLRHRHAITIRREPETARAMLGEQLWQMINGRSDQPSPPLTKHQLTVLIEAIEAL
ncbi:MAG TPA: hypothetical protein VH298_06760 [Jatrophihabitans sp.]|jgi:hypothetical protein|nr:hypothetical protein [Jatrophihabitans sp.]